jgi:hypothetical protein
MLSKKLFIALNVLAGNMRQQGFYVQFELIKPIPFRCGGNDGKSGSTHNAETPPSPSDKVDIHPAALPFISQLSGLKHNYDNAERNHRAQHQHPIGDDADGN